MFNHRGTLEGSCIKSHHLINSHNCLRFPLLLISKQIKKKQDQKQEPKKEKKEKKMKILNKQKKTGRERTFKDFDDNLLYKGSRHSPAILVPYKYKHY